eukprot:TRINITY_DN63997_c0_g1_i1.p1 TRINITY_DN63997_c0_g1~~TRINITY_DN63997_c0_g1_i1.p1  ORF type:complete len:730 (+),score=61.23 TRINITY_DN63997_c0_g1_i1:37-2226(+)
MNALVAVLVFALLAQINCDVCPKAPRRRAYLPTYSDSRERVVYLNHTHDSYSDKTTFVYELNSPCELPWGRGCGNGCNCDNPVACDQHRFCEWKGSDKTGSCYPKCMDDAQSWTLNFCQGDPTTFEVDPPLNNNNRGFAYEQDCGVFGLSWLHQDIKGGESRQISLTVPGHAKAITSTYSVSTQRKCFIGAVLVPTNNDSPAPPPPPNDCPAAKTTPWRQADADLSGISVELVQRPPTPEKKGGRMVYKVTLPCKEGKKRGPPHSQSETEEEEEEFDLPCEKCCFGRLSYFTINTCDNQADPSNFFTMPPVEDDYTYNLHCGLFGLTWRFTQLPGSAAYYTIDTSDLKTFSIEERDYVMAVGDTCYTGKTLVPVSFGDPKCDYLQCNDAAGEDAAQQCCNDLFESGCGWRVQNECIKHLTDSTNAFVRFIHGSYFAPAVDVYINDNLLLSSVVFGQTSKYLATLPGSDVAMQITAAGNPETSYASKTVTAEAKIRYTVVLVGKDKTDLSLTIDTDDAGEGTETANKNPQLRVFNGAADVDCVNVVDATSGETLLSRVGVRTFSKYTTMNLGKRTLSVTRCAELLPKEAAQLSASNLLRGDGRTQSEKSLHSHDGATAKIQTTSLPVGAKADELLLVEVDSTQGTAFTMTIEGSEQGSSGFPLQASMVRDYYSTPGNGPSPGPGPSPRAPGVYDKPWFWVVLGVVGLVCVVGLAGFGYLWFRRRAGYSSL